MSFKGNLKKSIALRVAEQRRKSASVEDAFAVLAAGNPDHCGPGGGGGRFTDKAHATCETPGGADASHGGGTGAEPTTRKGGGIPAIPEGGFPSTDYDKKGKPTPGTDAWLHVHGISRDVWNDRPYQRFEEGQSITDLPASIQALYANEPEATRQIKNMMKQTGGLIMVRSAVPGVSAGQESVVPQTRPDVPVISDHGRRAYRATALKNATARTEMLKALDPAGLVKLQEGRVEKAKTALETAKTIDHEGYTKYARDRQAAAQTALSELESGLPHKGKGGTGKAIDLKGLSDEQTSDLEAARKEVTKANKGFDTAVKDANRYFGTPGIDTPAVIAENTAKFRELETNNSLKSVGRAESKLTKINAMDNAGKIEQIGKEVETAAGFQQKAQNAFDKTAAKYLFPPNPASEKDKIDSGQVLGKAGRVNAHGEENLKNLLDTKTNGRVYLAMEGNIKEDSLLSAIADEHEKGASVISVPSVTLWRHKEMLEVAQKYLGNGREVVLIPDADGVNNPRVRNEARAMQALLESVGAKVVVAPPPIPLDPKTHKPIPDPAHPSKVQEFDTAIPGSPGKAGGTGEPTREMLKGADDYLGLGKDAPANPTTGERPKGVLNNLAVQRRVVPPISLDGEMDKIAAPNAELALKAISLIAGSKEIRDPAIPGGKKIVAAAQIGTTMLGAAMGKFSSRNAPQRSLKALEAVGIIKIERVYDEEALTRGIRRQNAGMTDARLNELVRAGVVDRPSFEGDDTRPIDWGYEETPIISINPSWKDHTGTVRDFTARDNTAVSLGSLRTHDQSVSRIKSLRSSGKTYEQIADILDVSASTIADALK